MSTKLKKCRNLSMFTRRCFKSASLTQWPRYHIGIVRPARCEEEKSLDDEEEELLNRQRFITNRREALHLYRDILRATRFFMWPDSRGVLWTDVLQENARKEFEEARFEKDPEIVTRLLIGGRDAVQSALEKLAEKQRQ
ncbi:hypothetical protein P3X46_020731 [Hevea brasiliensis]|uniref:Complex 1 LYR protein domain-containing protein n=1 Tax=Hevea brasiliensis TaxID=3981 RepID=A0ABQ9LEF4_HEVBR|nr:uncharacterized protein LOC110632152 [Hevea brasiliensis]KAJ9165918.1 hypothetical protein P3X46_020731 [Hevea brasiliensis]